MFSHHGSKIHISFLHRHIRFLRLPGTAQICHFRPVSARFGQVLVGENTQVSANGRNPSVFSRFRFRTTRISRMKPNDSNLFCVKSFEQRKYLWRLPALPAGRQAAGRFVLIRGRSLPPRGVLFFGCQTFSAESLRRERKNNVSPYIRAYCAGVRTNDVVLEVRFPLSPGRGGK
jgi:hypothetical protein